MRGKGRRGREGGGKGGREGGRRGKGEGGRIIHCTYVSDGATTGDNLNLTGTLHPH